MMVKITYEMCQMINDTVNYNNCMTKLSLQDNQGIILAVLIGLFGIILIINSYCKDRLRQKKELMNNDKNKQ